MAYREILKVWRMFSRRARTAARPAPRVAARSPRRSGTPDPRLTALWQELLQSYFPDRTDLLDYQIIWSNRHQKRTLASCNVSRRVVRVAPALNSEEGEIYLPAVIYHEMCHAVIGSPGRVRGKRPWHGAEFRALEIRHPGMEPLHAWMKSGGWGRLVLAQRHRRSRVLNS